MTALYNEIEPYAARWLENLIAAGHIAKGDVDARSIAELRAADLMGRTQCHFFAGIGVWSHALRLAGWPDDREVWTGSCPCQPFSAAGKGGGFDDERHLWPTWFALIRERRPATIFGEQVASPDGLKWLDLVHADLEGAGYAVGVADLCAAGVGAPHIRQRLYFVANADDEGSQRRIVHAERGDQRTTGTGGVDVNSVDGQDMQGVRAEHAIHGLGALRGAQSLELADARQVIRRSLGECRPDSQNTTERSQGPIHDQQCGGSGTLANAGGVERGSRRGHSTLEGRAESQRTQEQPSGRGDVGFWTRADWIACTDGKSRPVEPGTFPLAHGATARVGRLRAYGNAIVAQVAATFVRAAMESMP